MKTAVIADIHGNDLALEAVLADIDRQGIVDIVNLGDHFSGPLNPARTADLLMSRGIVCISGNHDRVLLTANPATMSAYDLHAHRALQDHHRSWLATLPATRRHADGALFLCHGTPASDTAYWMEDVTAGGTVHRAGEGRIDAFASGIDAAVLLCGHTHVPRLVDLADGRLVLNPGSVGCPAYEDDTPVPHRVETGTPRASYAVIEASPAGWTTSFRLVSYDHRAMARLAESNGRPDLARALATGWV